MSEARGLRVGEGLRRVAGTLMVTRGARGRVLCVAELGRYGFGCGREKGREVELELGGVNDVRGSDAALMEQPSLICL
jgi:hypothetical protein